MGRVFGFLEVSGIFHIFFDGFPYALAAMARGVTKTIFCNHINEMIVYLVQIRNISSGL